MPPNDFDQFVSRLQSKKESQSEFWLRQKEEYIAAVDGVYAEIEEFLSPWTQTGSINIEYYTLEINEEGIGLYGVRKCIIMIGSRMVALTPVGTQLIGTKGRIDLSGTFGRGRLVWVDADFSWPHVTVTIVDEKRSKKKAEPEPERNIIWVWKIATNPPQMKFLDFNKENFLKTVMDLTNG